MVSNELTTSCSQAYRGNFYGKRIVWLLRGWYQNGWWKVASTPALSCTADQIKLAAGMYLSTEELVFSNSTTDSVSGWVSQCCLYSDRRL